MAWHAYHTVWALLIFGWICNYIVRMAFSPLLEPVMAEFGLSHAEGGLLFSVFFYGYVAMQVPAGLLGDRFGRKRVLVLGILNTVAFSSSLWRPSSPAGSRTGPARSPGGATWWRWWGSAPCPWRSWWARPAASPT